MNSAAGILIVDDEQVVCNSCVRILSRVGFNAEAVIDPRLGLEMAQEGRYDAVLLDIKMDNLDGIEFLRTLRQEKPSLPVIMITGYLNQDYYTACRELGAADYIYKPFTPEELLRSLKRVVDYPSQQSKKADSRNLTTVAQDNSLVSPVTAKKDKLEPSVYDEFYFMQRSWLKVRPDGSVLSGAFLPRFPESQVKDVVIPRVHDIVYQGLPLAVIECKDGEKWLIPAPASGRVTRIVENVSDHLSISGKDPFSNSDIAVIKPFHLGDDLTELSTHDLILASPDEERRNQLLIELKKLGCCVYLASNSKKVLNYRNCQVLIWDAVSFDLSEAHFIAGIKHLLPDLRIIVLGESSREMENVYRQQSIFYYAIEPFVDGEIADILYNVFNVQSKQGKDRKEAEEIPKKLRDLRFINREGQKIKLLSQNFPLFRNSGLGQYLIDGLLRQYYPVTTMRISHNGEMDRTVANLEKTDNDLTIVLNQKDLKRLPGMLQIKNGTELDLCGWYWGKNVITFNIQPANPSGSVLDLEDQIMRSLAKLIIKRVTCPTIWF